VSEPARSQLRSETPSRTRSTLNAASRSTSAGTSLAPYSVPHSGSVRRRGRKSGLSVEDPAGESTAPMPDVDLDQVANLVGTVARSLHARPIRSYAKTYGSQHTPNGSRPSVSGPEPRPASSRLTSLNGAESSLTHPTQCTQVLIPCSRSLKSIKPSVVASSNAMDIDAPTPRPHIESNTMLLNTISSLSSQGLERSSRQRGPRVAQNSLVEADSVPRPSHLRQQLSPIIKRFGTSRGGNITASKTKNLGMKGALASQAASKPFKTPLPAVPKHVPQTTPNRSSTRREAVMDSPGNMSSDSLDTSFGIDIDCLEEHLKTYDG
jgi:hypothetical protein